MKQKGFTLIETLISILILSLTIGGLLSLAAGGYFSVRYASNDIVANNLAQESLEYIRNSRDSAILSNETWSSWFSGLTECSSKNGCIVDPYSSSNNIVSCSNNGCPVVYFYPDYGFYGYNTSNYTSSNSLTSYPTSYVRKITFQSISSNKDQALITVNVKWLNGLNSKSISQSMLLTNW